LSKHSLSTPRNTLIAESIPSKITQFSKRNNLPHAPNSKMDSFVQHIPVFIMSPDSAYLEQNELFSNLKTE
jgi:hypothetical protein